MGQLYILIFIVAVLKLAVDLRYLSHDAGEFSIFAFIISIAYGNIIRDDK
jgi:hypothetical protein